MEINMMNVGELIPYVNNPRDNDQAVDAVASSIKNFGFKVPIVIDSENEVIAGHTRLKAAKKLGMDQVPTIIADDLDENQVRAFRLADNRVGELADWDKEMLEVELLDIDGLDMEQFGFDELETLLEDDEVVEDEFDEEVPEEPKAKYGEVYQLGQHRLMCGDSTKEDDVAKLMNGKKAEMIFTDPPYLMNFTGSVHSDGSKSQNSSFGEIKNDSMSRGEGDEFILDIVRMINEYVEGAYYICFYRLGVDYVLRALDKIGNKYRALIIWDKGNHTLSNSDYMSKYEPIIYGWINKHNFYGPKGEYDIWEIKRTKRNDLHPTMKPLELVERAIKNSSKKGDIVLDLFGGSGSTMITSEQTERVNYSMELDPRYVDVIINRWEEYTGEKAVLIEELGESE